MSVPSPSAGPEVLASLSEHAYLAGAVAIVLYPVVLLLSQVRGAQGASVGGKFAKDGGVEASSTVAPAVFTALAALAVCAAGPVAVLTWLFVIALVLLIVFAIICWFGSLEEQSPLSLLAILWNYRSVDFTSFLKSHDEAFQTGSQTGNYVPGVCNYYELMSDLITLTSGPFWHFVPLTDGLNRKECHDKFHHTTVEFLGAQSGDAILEFGCGFGECGRQVAKISGASVTGLTMAEPEIAGGNERIRKAGLQDRCKMVQGNYHQMPFADCSFDKVFGLYTLKYSSDLDKAISEAARVLKPGGKFLSYEIIVTDAYDPSNKEHKQCVYNISYSTCMPPLWHAQAFRDAATRAGLVLTREVDLCEPACEGAWYSCFERTRTYPMMKSRVTKSLVRLAEALHILPESFTEFFEACLVHPLTDFVEGGRLGIVNGAVMMVWEKPRGEE